MYFKLLKDQDLHHGFEVNGKMLNTPYWIIAHLATSENGLLLGATGGPFEKFTWAKHYTLGAPGLPVADRPPFEEIYSMFNAVHAKVMDHIPTLTTEQLDAPNATRLSAIGDTVRDVITHAIRHEGSHAGHLGWLCKLHGVRTM
jgi:hypothetical protein